MSKGFRIEKQPSRKQVQQKTDTELQNLQMSVRVSQMMIQQLMQNVKVMGEDLGAALNQLYELQYKYIAMQEHMKLDVNQLNDIANNHRLKDFNEASQKADERENLLPSEVVDNNSTIVITSVAKDETGQDKGIFRSRLKLADAGVPELTSQLSGKKVGDRVKVKLNVIDHDVELLAIKKPTSVTSPLVDEATT